MTDDRELQSSTVPFDDVLELSDVPEGSDIVEISIHHNDVHIEYFDSE